MHVRVFTFLTENIIEAHGAIVTKSYYRIHATAITIVACVFDLSLLFEQAGESFAAVFLFLLEPCDLANWEEASAHTYLARDSLFVHFGAIAD